MLKRAWCIAVVVASFLAVFVGTARAADTPPPLRIGERGFAELAANETVEFTLAGLVNSKLSLTVAAWNGASLNPGFALIDPDGVEVNFSPYASLLSSGRGFVVRNLPLTKTGIYLARISAQSGTSGGFDITVGGKYAAKVSVGGNVTDASAEVIRLVPAVAADVVSLQVKRVGRSSVKPLIVRFEDAAVGTTTWSPGKAKAKVTANSTGAHRVAVVGANGTMGEFSLIATLRHAKGGKQWRDLNGFIERGSISGTVVVPGAVPPGPSKRAGPQKRSRRQATPVRPAELIVSIPSARSSEDVQAALAAALPGDRFEVLAALTETGPYLVRATSLVQGARRRDEGRTRALARAAKRSSLVAWSEANGVVSGSKEPNDARWVSQEDMLDMRLPEAWDVTTGSSSMVVAVIDTGIWTTHPDLSGRLLAGYDFVQNATSAADGGGWDADPTDSAHNFHGTHVAGTIAATSNNRSGVAGVTWNSKVLPVRVLGKNGGTNFDVAAGVRWASGLSVSGVSSNPNPARVINLSLGSAGSSQALSDAVAAAINAGVVVVAAAGNEDTSAPSYPAAYPGVIAVSAVAPDFYPASYSNYGNWISVSAPGGDQDRGLPGILSTFVDESTLQATFRELQGTSMASPHVAGVAALMLSVNPSLTPAQVKTLLESTAFDIDEDGFDIYYGAGIVDAAAAVEAAAGSSAPGTRVSVSPELVRLSPGSNEATIQVRNTGNTPVTLSSVSATTKSGAAWLSASASGTGLPATVRVAVNRGILTPGVHQGTVRLALSSGAISVPVQVVVASAVDPGTVRVQAVGTDGLVQAEASTTLSAGFDYTIEGLPPGDYTLVAYVDRDSDNFISRVDEWYGRWPLASDPRPVTVGPSAMHQAALDFSIARQDSAFNFEGAGGGSVRGAVGVLVLDEITRGPIAGARVYVNSAQGTAVTDEAGRAVITGAYTGAQTITVAADGYDTFSTVGCNAQYQSFTLNRRDPPTTDVTVTIYGLGWDDEEVIVQVGEAVDVLTYYGSGQLSTTLTVARGSREIPVWVYAKDIYGLPSKIDLTTLDPGTLGATASVDLVAYSPDDNYWYIDDMVVRRPTSGMDAASTTLFVTEGIYFSDSESLLIGLDSIPDNTYSEVDWISFGSLDSELSASMVASAFDDFGRESHAIVNGTVDALGFPGWVTLNAPPIPTSPAAGAGGVALAPTFSFAPMVGADVNFVNITDAVTGLEWVVMVPGGTTSFTLPTLPSDGLAGLRGHSWDVNSYDSPGFNFASYLDSALTVDATAYAVSETRTFSTR